MQSGAGANGSMSSNVFNLMQQRSLQATQEFDRELATARPTQARATHANGAPIQNLSAEDVKYLYSVLYASAQIANSQEMHDNAQKYMQIFMSPDFDNPGLTSQTAHQMWNKLNPQQKDEMVKFLREVGYEVADQAYAEHASPVKMAIEKLARIFQDESQSVHAVGSFGQAPPEEEMVELPSVRDFNYTQYFGINMVRVAAPKRQLATA
jgi:hypothetical protein